ncbi:MAG: hypothetical protein ISR80_04310 [Nitrosopumilus sp.]|nr:hypothetical protein [Nitrosopumilus sp.]
MHENKNSTVIENGKIKWKIFDSKDNQYDWELPIQTYESYIKNTTYRTQIIQYSDGREHEIGEFSDYVETSFTNVIDDIYENSNSDNNFIYEIWYIVSQLTTYSPDIGEHPRYAIETLTRGGGDCEDTTILMADLLKSSKHTENWNIQMVYFDSENPTDPKLVNHVALAVNTEENFGILETTAKNIDDLITWDVDSIVGWWSDV